jgi:hypothetical protein
MSLWKHDSVRYVYSLYPEAAKLKDSGGRQFCTMQQRSENIRLAHSYCPENISVKDAVRFAPTFICEMYASREGMQ